MNSLVFSFSYINKKKIADFKSQFFLTSLNSKYNLSFLTKKNFNSFFNKEFINLNHILSGKYLIFTLKEEENLENMITNDLDIIKKLISSLEINLNLFLVTYNKVYYFYDFFLESKKYSTFYLYKDLFNVNYLHNVKYFIMFMMYFTYTFNRINNLNKMNILNNYTSYML